MSQDFYYGTGKRKSSISRTRLYQGKGEITINGRSLEDYFPRATLRMVIRQPLMLTKTRDQFDMRSTSLCQGINTRKNRSVDPPDPAENKQTSRHNGTGVPTRNENIALAVFKQLKTHNHGGVFFRSYGFHRRISREIGRASCRERV